MPNLNPNPLIYDGPINGDSRRVFNQTFRQLLVGNATPVQATNPTSATDLMTATLQAGTLDTVGQTLEIFAMGITNLTTTTATLTLSVKLGGVTIATFTTGAVAIGALNLPWNLNLFATVASVDSGGNVTLETHGTLSQNLTTVAAATTSYNDANVAVSSSIKAGSPLLLEFVATISAGNAASFVSQRQACVYLDN